jgi:hypothetical protein
MNMRDQYHINLEQYSLQKFKSNLEARDMIPSRVSLKDNLDERFRVLENAGITNLKELIDALKTKQKIEQFSKETGLPTQYLTLLNREAKSYLPKPIRLDKFPGISNTVIEKLGAVNIKNSRHLFNAAQGKSDREGLAKNTGVPIACLNELVSLSDLARIYGVGPVFARMIFDVGIHSIQDFVRCTAEDFIEIYENQTQKKADFGVNEIEFSLELAKALESEVDE